MCRGREGGGVKGDVQKVGGFADGVKVKEHP